MRRTLLLPLDIGDGGLNKAQMDIRSDRIFLYEGVSITTIANAIYYNSRGSYPPILMAENSFDKRNTLSVKPGCPKPGHVHYYPSDPMVYFTRGPVASLKYMTAVSVIEEEVYYHNHKHTSNIWVGSNEY